jgi:Protein of unknown function (DUF3618)
MPARSPEEIRASIEAHRRELGAAVEGLQGEIAIATDWRGHIRRNERNLTIGAAATGFVLGGGIGGIVGLIRRIG